MKTNTATTAGIEDGMRAGLTAWGNKKKKPAKPTYVQMPLTPDNQIGGEEFHERK